MDALKTRFILFTRFPVPGRTKTRLIPQLGPDRAAELQRAMAADIVEQLGAVPGEREVYFEGGTEEDLRDWLGPDLAYTPQEGIDLGLRMRQAFKNAFEQGAGKVLIVGSDCPAFDETVLTIAVNELESQAAVLGPAADGGYYLIGFRHDGFQPEVFTGPAWGGTEVLNTTCRILEEQGCMYSLLHETADIDTFEDLQRLAGQADLKERAPRTFAFIEESGLFRK
jgi:rSAM/selenodomain-associated transferase 1